MPQTTATMNFGCRAISDKRPPAFALVSRGGIGIFSSISVQARDHRNRRLRDVGGGEQIGRQHILGRDHDLRADNGGSTPPISTNEIAFGRNASLAVSAAAKR